MQFLAAVPGTLLRLARGFALAAILGGLRRRCGDGGRRLALDLLVAQPLFLDLAHLLRLARFLLGHQTRLFFFLEPLAFRLRLEFRLCLALDLQARLLLGQPLRFQRFLFLARRVLENVPLDVGPLLAHLDADRPRAALTARQAQLALRASFQSDLPGRCLDVLSLATVRAAQVREQLQLRIVTDQRIGPTILDAGLGELRQQAVDGYLQHLGELSDRDIGHNLLRSPAVIRPGPLLRRTRSRALS